MQKKKESAPLFIILLAILRVMWFGWARKGRRLEEKRRKRRRRKRGRLKGDSSGSRERLVRESRPSGEKDPLGPIPSQAVKFVDFG